MRLLYSADFTDEGDGQYAAVASVSLSAATPCKASMQGRSQPLLLLSSSIVATTFSALFWAVLGP